MGAFEVPLPRIRPARPGDAPLAPPNPRIRPALSSDSGQPDLFGFESHVVSEAVTPATQTNGGGFDDLIADSHPIGETVATEASRPAAEPVVESGGYVGEAAKAVGRGAAGMAGTTVSGLAALDPTEAYARDIDAYREDLLRVPTMRPDELTALQTRIAGEKSAITRRILQTTVEDLSTGALNPDVIRSQAAPTPLGERELYKAGESITKAGKEAFPVAPGWENSVTAAIGEGVGSLVAGAGATMLGGPMIAGAGFAAAGVGEAAERAVEHDRAERAAGRPGLSEQQMTNAAVMGIGPGATDIVPIEMLMGGFRVPMPFRRPLARAIARIGGQVFVEGVQEGGQEFLQNLIQQEYDPSQDLTENIPGSAGIGGGVGGLAGTVVEVARLFGGRRGGHVQNLPPTEEEPAPPEGGEPPPLLSPPQGDEFIDLDADFDEKNPAVQPQPEPPEVSPVAPSGVVESEGSSAAGLGVGGQSPERQQPQRGLPPPVPENLQPSETVQTGPKGAQPVIAAPPPVAEPAAANPLDDIRAALTEIFNPDTDSHVVGTRPSPAKVTTPEELANATAVTAEPTPGQASAGNFQHAHVDWQAKNDLDGRYKVRVMVETPKGGVRRSKAGVEPPWEVKDFPHDYGYAPVSVAGKDGKLDISIVGFHPRAYVVDQRDLTTGKFDEHKVQLGAASEAEAVAAYVSGYSDGRGQDRVMGVTPMPIGKFIKWKGTYDPTKPLATEAKARIPEVLPPAAAGSGGVAAPSGNAVEPEPKAVKKVAKKRRWVKEGQVPNAIQFIGMHGGIKDESGELKHAGIHKRYPGLVNNRTGMSHDRVREILAEGGYLDHLYGNPETAIREATPADVRALLPDGKNVFPGGAKEVNQRADEAAAEQEAGAADESRRDIEDELSDSDIPNDDEALIDRASLIRQETGLSPGLAIQRAMSELEAEDATSAEIAEHENALAPGWENDVYADENEQPSSRSEVGKDGADGGTRPKGGAEAVGRAPAEGGKAGGAGGDESKIDAKDVALAKKHGAEIIADRVSDVPQYRAGKGSIVTAWHNSEEEAYAAYTRELRVRETIEAGADGKPQAVIPGAEAKTPEEIATAKIAAKAKTEAEKAKVRAQQSKIRKANQKPADEQEGGIFYVPPASGDLLSQPAKRPEPTAPEMGPFEIQRIHTEAGVITPVGKAKTIEGARGIVDDLPYPPYRIKNKAGAVVYEREAAVATAPAPKDEFDDIWEKVADEQFGSKPSASIDDIAASISDILGGGLEAPTNPFIESAAFAKWFGKSKVVDGEGKPRVVYHGTQQKVDFDAFKRKLSDIGIHFGTEGQANDRINYKVEIGGAAPIENMRIIPVYLSIESPLRLRDAGSWDAISVQDALLETGEFLGHEIGNALHRKSGTGELVALRDLIERKGYDGIVYKNEGETSGAEVYRAAVAEARAAMVKAGVGRHSKSGSSYGAADQLRPEYGAWQAAEDAYRRYRKEHGEDSYIAFHPEQIKSVANRGTFDATGTMLHAPENPFVDPAKYERLKPHFKAGLQKQVAADADLMTMVRGLYKALAASPKMDRLAMEAMKPYIRQYVDDVASGKESLDVSGPRGSVEPDRGDAGAQDDLGAADVPATSGATDVSAGEGRGPAQGGERIGGARGGIPEGGTPTMGGGGNLELPARKPGTGTGPQPDTGQPERGGGDSQPRLFDEPSAAQQTEKNAQSRADLNARKKAQAAAESIPVSYDQANIDATLPMLYPEQRSDVLRAEQRFGLIPSDQVQKGHGFLLTNGTGTGKTFSALGVIKRMTKAGKGQILVVAPSQGVIEQWQQRGRDMLIEAHILESTADRGKSGLNLTTFANLYQNSGLASRKWDMVVADEAHLLTSNQAGEPAKWLNTFRALTMHPRGLHDRARMVFHREWAEVEKIDQTKNEGAWRRAYDAYNAKAKPQIEAWTKQIETDPFGSRPPALMLSASPFAYHFSLDYAEGYLFDYPPDTSGGYNHASGRNAWYVQNLGYRMRTGKLTQPEADVNSDIMERQVHEKMKATGALSGRQLNLEVDYDRKFALIDDAVGKQIDTALSFLQEADGGKFRHIHEMVSKKFDYLSRMRLLEAIKARHAVDIIKEHHKLGRKVVVFHNYNEGGGFSPFDLTIDPGQDVYVDNKRIKLKPLYDEFMARNPYVEKLDFAGFLAPLYELQKAFPNALVYNGTVSKGKRSKAKEQFNSPDQKYNLIIVQSAAGEFGVDFHDTVGDAQRVLMNLGMPIRPVSSLQQEGRIYRDGSMSDAIYRYMNTGTAWERWTYAGTIAERAGTAENLAMGNVARQIRQSFIDAFEATDDYPPEAGEGKGGKEADRGMYDAISEFERAKTHYFAQQKTAGRRDQRAGKDYFATPEPLGLKMVEWANVRPGEKILEPSAGHGAISRYFPETSARTLVEPSADLASRAALSSPGARVVVDRFENLNVGANKFHAIVMNPPFGHGGSEAMAHVKKAAQHLLNGGRLVAILPRGPAADKAWEKLYESDDPVMKPMRLVADFTLPSVTFERAGTSVSARVVILDKQTDDKVARETLARVTHRDYGDAETIKDFFDRIENAEVPERLKPITIEVEPAAEGATEIEVGGIKFKLIDVTGLPDGTGAVFGAKPVGHLGDGYRQIAEAARAAGGAYVKGIGRFEFPNAAARQDFFNRVQNPETAGKAQPKPGEAVKGVSFVMADERHTKTGQAIFVARIDGRVDRDVYDKVKAAASKHGGGYWSPYSKGFLFTSKEFRQAFIDEVVGRTATKPEPDTFGFKAPEGWDSVETKSDIQTMRAIYEARAALTSGGHVDLGAFQWREGVARGRQMQDYVSAKGYEAGVEFVVGVDAKGEAVLHGHGTEYNTGNLGDRVNRLLSDQASQLVIHHNHPNEAGFSLTDLSMLGAPGLHTLWAHDVTGTSYRARLTPVFASGFSGFPATRVKLMQFITGLAYRGLRDAIRAAVSAGTIHPVDDKAARIFGHLVSVTMRDAGIIDYRSSIDEDPTESAAVDAFIEKAGLKPHMKRVLKDVRNASNHLKGPRDVSVSADDGRAVALRHPGNVGATLGRGPAIAGRVLEGGNAQAGAGNGRDQARGAKPTQLRLPGFEAPLIAFHGTGAGDFERFDLSKIGTGQGAQSYSYGLYFAGKEAVSKRYRDELAKTTRGHNRFWGKKLTGKYIESLKSEATNADADVRYFFTELYPRGLSGHGRDVIGNIQHRVEHEERQIAHYRDMLDTAVEVEAGRRPGTQITWNAADQRGRIAHSERIIRAYKVALEGYEYVPEASTGRMYEVEIDIDPDHMLDWDKPISQQTEHVKAALTRMGLDEPLPGTTVEELINHLTRYREGDGYDAYAAARRQAAKRLLDAGIPGVRYLDQGSRGGAAGRAFKLASEEEAVKKSEDLYAAGWSVVDISSSEDGVWTLWATPPETHNYVVYDDSRIKIARRYQAHPLPAVRTDFAANDLVTLKNDLQAMVSRIAGKRVPVEFEPRLTIPGGIDYSDALSAGGVSNTEIAGYIEWNGIPGYSLIALATDGVGARTAAGHESWHHIWKWLLSDAEHSILQADLAKGAASKIRQMAAAEWNVTPESELVRRMPDFELQAFAFQRYRRMHEEGGEWWQKEVSGLHIAVRRFFNRLTELFRQITRMLGRKNLKVEDIFADARKGEYARADDARVDREIAENGFIDAQMSGGFEAPRNPFEDGPIERAAMAMGIPGGGPSGSWARQIMARISAGHERARYLLQDRYLSWRREQEGIEASPLPGSNSGAARGQLPSEVSPYQAMRLYPGRAGERMENLRERYVEPLVRDMQSSSVDADELGQFLYAMHAKDRNALILSRDPNNAAGSGMTDREANGIIRTARQDPRAADFMRLARRVWALNDATVEYRVAEGLLSREQADAWKTALGPHYVPLRGHEVDPDDGIGPRSGRGFDVRGRESQTALGRFDKADNPLAYSLMQASEAIIRAEKNRVNKIVYRFVRTYPDPDRYSIFAGQATRYLDKTTGLMRVRWDPPSVAANRPINRDQTFGVKHNGKVRYVYIEDPVLARALRGVGNDAWNNAVIRGVFRTARVFAMMQTQLNPGFILPNIVRDLETAMLNITDTPGAPTGIRRKMGKSLLKSIRGIYKALGDPNSQHEHAQYFEEFRMAGGKISFLQWNDVGGIKRQIDKLHNRGPASAALHHWFKRLVIDTNTAAENGIRLAAFVELRRAGVDVARASFIARDLTVDFNLHGELGPLVNAMWVFWNAGTQGTYRLARSFARSRKVRYAVLGMFAFGMLLDWINSMMADDSDDTNKYDSIKDFVKERNVVFMLPGNKRGSYIKFPIAWGLNFPMFAGQQFSAMLRGARKPLDGAYNVLHSAMGAFNPWGDTPSVGQMLAPTLVDPFIQTGENMTWYGGPIYPTKFNERMPDSELSWPSTPSAYKATARFLNRATGGNAGRPGFVDVSPETIQHFVEFAGGGAGRTAFNILKTSSRTANGEEVLPENIPILDRFFGSSESSTARRGAFYDAWDMVNGADYEVKALEKAEDWDGADRARERNAKEIDAYDTMHDVYKQLTEIRKERAVAEAKHDSEAQKELDERERQELDRARQAYPLK